MKFVMIAMLALSASSAFAGGALDAQQYNYGDESLFPKAATSCVNGTKQIFVESINGLDKYVNVTRVCVGGVYYTRTFTKVQPCRNGAIAVWATSNSINDNQPSATFVCVNGKYVRQ